tara:strand:+ start:123 stop:473 length:351 start_codon:yes stop_codon:yes gene_type:complete
VGRTFLGILAAVGRPNFEVADSSTMLRIAMVGARNVEACTAVVSYDKWRRGVRRALAAVGSALLRILAAVGRPNFGVAGSSTMSRVVMVEARISADVACPFQEVNGGNSLALVDWW